MDERSDQELVRAAQTGNLQAFEVLVQRHQAFIVSTAMRMVRHRATAEDIAQEALFRAWRSLPGFRGDAQFRSWVYRIATNLALNHLQRGRDIPVEVVPEADATQATESTAVEAAMEQSWRAAVQRLPKELREPYALREESGMPYEDIATTLDIPLNTVRTRIHRARKKISEEMREWR